MSKTHSRFAAASLTAILGACGPSESPATQSPATAPPVTAPLDGAKLPEPTPHIPERLAALRAPLLERRALTPASPRVEIEALQQLLNDVGTNLSLTVDGAWGPRTRNAIQRTASRILPGAEVDSSRVDARLLMGLLQMLPPQQSTSRQVATSAPPPLEVGARGESVREAQQLLRERFDSALECDGEFGRGTQYVVALYQLTRGLPVTGTFDDQTRTALRENRERVPCDAARLPRSEERGFRAGRPFAFTARHIGGFAMKHDAAEAFVQMVDAALSDGILLRLNSAFRSNEEQTRLYQAYQAGTGNLAARPGWSNHQSGIALDINVDGRSSATYRWLAANAGRFGFRETVPSEAWHWEYHGRPR